MSDSKRRKRSSVGSKTKLPNGRWQVRVSCGYKRDGSPRRVSRTVDTEHEADLLIARMRAEMSRDPNVGDAVTLADYYRERFVPGREGRVTRATMADYECQWRNRIEPEFGWRALSDVRHADVQAWALTMTRPTAEHAVRALRAILRDAWANGYLADEPMRRRISYPEAAPKDGPDVWTAAQVARALPAMEGCPLEGLWLLMVGGGLSRSEAAAVTWGDVLFALSGSVSARVSVTKALTNKDGLKGTKNRFRTRTVTIGEPFASRLYAVRGAADERVYRGCVDRVDTRWRALFDAEPAKKHGKKAPWSGRLARAGLPFVHLGRMRATHETMMHEVVPDNALIARQHGRSNVQTGYAHYYEPDTSGTADKIAGLF